MGAKRVAPDPHVDIPPEALAVLGDPDALPAAVLAAVAKGSPLWRSAPRLAANVTRDGKCFENSKRKLLAAVRPVEPAPQQSRLPSPGNAPQAAPGPPDGRCGA